MSVGLTGIQLIHFCSENIFCLVPLPTFSDALQDTFAMGANTVNPDQTAPSGNGAG